MARWVWMEFIDKLNPNHYYCHATYQKTNWSPTFPAKMGTKKTFQLLFCVLGLLEFEGNHIISLHSCYQHKKTIFWIRIRIQATLLRECFFALNAQHFSIFLQSWAKYCGQVHKIKWNSFFSWNILQLILKFAILKHNRQNLSFRWAVGYLPSIPSISWIFLKFTNFY